MWIIVFSIVGLVTGWTVCALLTMGKREDLEMETLELTRKQEETMVELRKLVVEIDTLKAVVEQELLKEDELYDYDL
jgi:argonaute-like protein implicated in RNA metabolism and viral defense